MINKSHVIFLSSGGFPFKISAASQKYKLMAKALLAVNYRVTLLTKLNTYADLVSHEGEVEGINYSLLSGTRKRKGIIDKLVGQIKGYFFEFAFIVKAKRDVYNNFLILSYCFFPLLFYYYLLSKLTGIKIIISIMEYHPSIAKGFFSKINAYLFDHYSSFFANGILPISNYLKQVVNSSNKGVPNLIVPVLADFNEFNQIQISSSNNLNYFLFCGSIGYKDTIQFVTDAFSLLNCNDAELILVLSGKKNEIEELKQSLQKNTRIKILSNISYTKLYSLYSNALGLLIPMRPNIQDKARFPQKIAEYLASGRPVITNNYGEISYYFKDGFNSLVVAEYDINQYAAKMEWVLRNRITSKEVGLRGKEFGRKNFHYRNYSNKLEKFFRGL